ncbi:response regulator transcription factor [Luteolibacter yonseiensis]|uniref:Response regulator transcription factor n=1 Tax=Luteolibacter yonseiensis TaxID=1144680 RepID=A0A934VCH7_9BACT|nr:response regulator transcription factor [Luteolibacter yonseiensis]MBK1816981.1 response regulator transcription factor [Luteolibacter yonseiensis]
MRLLFVEDSKRLQQTVGTALRRAGFAVDVTGNGQEGLWLAEANEYDVIVLDIMLPGLDGLGLLKQLRDQGRNTHVLLLTARDTVADRVRGLHAGADDYLVKPFALEELLARVQALCRRAYDSKQNKIIIGDMHIDTAARTVSRAGHVIMLQAREYALVEYLARRAGQVVSRTEIESHIYDGDTGLMSNVVDSAVCAVRRKLHVANPEPIIHTRRGQGYVMNPVSP